MEPYHPIKALRSEDAGLQFAHKAAKIRLGGDALAFWLLSLDLYLNHHVEMLP